ncbi:hypothetical protein [Bacillus thuringiensis]|uniref:hypothetical protein n=1 Tax=Bacillus cereus group TaxID=86661 RepID=UPI00077E1CE7|nr:hypothetical protein [Bacillus thuringiensis]AMR06561.1 hypothetical protein AXW78_30045 [Bacillus thuringiensis]PNK26883.1 hypothetical protein CBR55_31675 [Bacillus thuringiensis]
MQPYEFNPITNYSYIPERDDCLKECLQKETGLDPQAITEIIACLGRCGLDFWCLAGCIGLSLARRIWRAVVKCWGECSYYKYSIDQIPGACIYITRDGNRHCQNVRSQIYCEQIKESPDVIWAEFYPLRQCPSS